MAVLFGDIRVSLPLTVRCARTQHGENTHLIQTEMFHNRIRRLSVAAKLLQQDMQMCWWAEGREVEIILKYNTLKQNKCELSRLAPSVPVLMLPIIQIG